MEEIELLDGASAEFSQEEVSKGQLTPVFFGSALTNFGVETFLEHFLKMTTSPLPRTADCVTVDPMSDDFSAFVFKIQANMNKAHRDRIAFMRICSGKFDATKEVYHVQGDKKMAPLLQPQQMMADPVMLWRRRMQVISSVSLTRVFFLLEIPSAHLERNLPLRGYRPSRRSISHVCVRSIP